MEETIAKFTEVLYYCGGRLWNKIDRGKGSRAHNYAAKFDKGCGYNRLSFGGKKYLEHRVIFAMHHGYWPKMVDHINGNKTDNRVENLRDAYYRRNNTVNSKIRSDNTSGYRGVINHKQANGWVAQGSRPDGTRKHLGVFLCPKEAALAYNHHAEETYGPFATFNEVFEDHDETLASVADESQAREALKYGIDKLNQDLNLNVSFGIDTQTGKNYSETH